MMQVFFRPDLDLPEEKVSIELKKSAHREEKLKVWLDFLGLRKEHLE